MSTPEDTEAARQEEIADRYGALVGWTCREFNDSLDLKLQSIDSACPTGRDEVDAHHFIMTRSQAAVLANFLLKVSGQTPPRQRGFLQRLMRS